MEQVRARPSCCPCCENKTHVRLLSRGRSASAELLLQRLWACAALLSRRSSPSSGSAQCRVLLSALRFLRAAEDALCGGGEEVGGLLVALRVYLLHTANVLLSNHPRGGSRGGESSIPLDDESACQLGLLLQSQVSRVSTRSQQLSLTMSAKDLSVVRQTAALADRLLRLRPPQGLAGAPAPDEWWPLSELQLGLLADCLFNCLCRRADHHALITGACPPLPPVVVHAALTAPTRPRSRMQPLCGRCRGHY